MENRGLETLKKKYTIYKIEIQLQGQDIILETTTSYMIALKIALQMRNVRLEQYQVGLIEYIAVSLFGKKTAVIR